jgi:hypothetical protein
MLKKFLAIALIGGSLMMANGGTADAAPYWHHGWYAPHHRYWHSYYDRWHHAHGYWAWR